MGLFKLFKKKTQKFEINKINEDNLVVMLCPKNKIKLGAKIVVPENFCAVVLSKEKLLDEFPSGEFEIGGLTCPKVCKLNKLDKPTKDGYKTEFGADFYFVNLKENVVKNSFFVKKYKTEVEILLLYKVEDCKKFLNFLKDEQAVFENDFAQNELKFYASQIVYYYALDNKTFDKNKIEIALREKLNKIGILLENFEMKTNAYQDGVDEKDNKKTMNVNNFENIKNEENEKSLSNFDGLVNQTSEDLKECEHGEKENANIGFEKKRSSVVDLDDIKTSNITFFACPKCGTRLAENASKCFVCGESFVEKNLCENCGREISKQDYVCPYCKSVIIWQK